MSNLNISFTFICSVSKSPNRFPHSFKVTCLFDATMSLTQKRGRILGSMTRARRRAFVIIDSRGSKRQLTAIIKELDGTLEQLQEVNDEIISTLESEEDISLARRYLVDAEQQHQEAVDRIEAHLAERRDEVSSAASHSQTTARTTASREAEIDLKVKQFETAQLERRLTREKEAQELERQCKLQESQDAQDAAKLRAQLVKQDELNWDRQGDFDGEFADHGCQHIPARTVGAAQGAPSIEAAGLPHLSRAIPPAVGAARGALSAEAAGLFHSSDTPSPSAAAAQGALGIEAAGLPHLSRAIPPVVGAARGALSAEAAGLFHSSHTSWYSRTRRTLI